MARTLTVKRDAQTGLLGIYHGRTRMALINQPIYELRLGIIPTAAEVREMVRECCPGYGVTDATPIRFQV